jgi:hypothetical protein
MKWGRTKKPPTQAWTVAANAGAAFAYRMTTTERCTDMIDQDRS